MVIRNFQDKEVKLLENNENDVLVDISYYSEWNNSQNIRFIEVDVDTTTYSKGHLPGAVNLSWDTQLNDKTRRDIISQKGLEEILSTYGITSETELILYGDNNNWFAAFAYWILKYYGHEKVRILNGGRTVIENNQIGLVTEIPNYKKTDYKFNSTPDEHIRAKRSEVLGKIGSAGFVDVRSPAEYTGEILAPPGLSETAQRGGHIPTAKNIPWSQAVNEDGTFKSKEYLKGLYEKQGITKDNEVITYCRIGERSSHSWFVLSELLQYENVKNYDGSWTEYGNLIDAPIQVGNQP